MKRTSFILTVLASLSLSLTCSLNLEAKMTADKMLNKVHKMDVREIKLGQFAVRKGYSSETRNYGKKLVADYLETDRKVSEIAAKKGITLKPLDCVMTDLEMVRLEAHKGPDFDKAFAETMARHHKRDIAKFQKIQDAPGLSEEVRDLLAELLPTVQIHQEQAQEIASKKYPIVVNAPTSSLNSHTDSSTPPQSN